MIGMIPHKFPSRIMKREVQKFIIMVTMEKIRDERPNIIFWGKDIKKSSSV